MSFNTITTVVNLLAALNSQREREIITKVNEFFDVDQNIFLLESSVDADRFVSCEHMRHYCPPQSLITWQLLNDAVTTPKTISEVKSKSTFLVVGVDNEFEFSRSEILFQRVMEIHRLNVDTRTGLFFTQHIEEHDVRSIFEWCWNHQIVQIFIAFPSSDGKESSIFHYDPLGMFKVIKVADTESSENYFPSQTSNFNGHPIRLGIYENIWLFQYTAENQRIGGPDGKLWKVLLQHLNASFTVVIAERDKLWQMLEANDIDVIPFAHRFPPSQFNHLYPISMETEVIVVPEALPFAAFVAYLHAITSATFFMYSAVTVVTVTLLLFVIRYCLRQKILFFQCVADVFNLLLNDNGSINYREQTGSEAFLLVPLTFVGFVVVNGIFSSLQSYVTRPFMQDEIDTVDDLSRSPFPIFTFSEYTLL